MDGKRETYRGVGFVVFGSFVFMLLSSSSSLRDVGSVMLSMLCFLVLKGDMVPRYGGQAVGVRTKFGTGFAQKCYAYYIIVKHNIRALEPLHSTGHHVMPRKRLQS